MSILLLGCRWNSVGHAPGSGYFGPTGFDLVSANGFPPFPCRHAPATIGNLQSHRQRDAFRLEPTLPPIHMDQNGRRHPALYAPSTNFRRRTLGLPRAAAAVVMGARSSAVGRIVFGAAARQGHNVVGGFAAAAIAPIIVALQDGQTELAPAPRVIAASASGGTGVGVDTPLGSADGGVQTGFGVGLPTLPPPPPPPLPSASGSAGTHLGFGR
jgi:hypothetical protein